MLSSTLWGAGRGGVYYFHFPDEESGAQGGHLPRAMQLEASRRRGTGWMHELPTGDSLSFVGFHQPAPGQRAQPGSQAQATPPTGPQALQCRDGSLCLAPDKQY